MCTRKKEDVLVPTEPIFLSDYQCKYYNPILAARAGKELPNINSFTIKCA
jgi:hypothetical protein